MFSFIGRWYRRRLRAADREILWTAIKEHLKHTQNIALCRRIMLFHALNDPAWTKDYTETEIIEIIEGWD